MYALSLKSDRRIPLLAGIPLCKSWELPQREYSMSQLLCRCWNICSGHLPVGLCHGQGSLLLVCPLFHFYQCHNCLVSSRNEHVCPYHSITRFLIWQKRILGVFTLNCLQTGLWIRVDYYIVMKWTYVPVVVQCQNDSCNLSSNASFAFVAVLCVYTLFNIKQMLYHISQCVEWMNESYAIYIHLA